MPTLTQPRQFLHTATALLLLTCHSSLRADISLKDFQSPSGGWDSAAAATLQPGNPAGLTITPGEGILFNGPDGHTSNLLTRDSFGDVQVHLEFCLPKGSNSGIYLMGRYEIQIYDSYGVPKDKYPGIECGGIYPRWTQDRGEFEGHSPSINATLPPGDWQSFDILFRAPRFDASGRKVENARFIQVLHNNVPIHHDIELTGPTRASHWEDEQPLGPLMIQGDHGPVAIRNLAIQPLADAASSDLQPRTFFLSPTGSDSNPGSLSAPFKTFEAAQKAARSERKLRPERGVTVTFLPGIYTMDSTWIFTGEDSGASATQPTLYQAAPGSTVKLSGGSAITDWAPDPDFPNAWRAKAPAHLPHFEQLWVNGQRAIRARTPNWWNYSTLTDASESPVPGSSDLKIHTLTTRPENLHSLQNLSPTALRQTQIVVHHKWDTTREWLQQISPETGTITTHGTEMKSWNPMTRDCLFYIENYPAALDAPGEWFLDQSGWVHYIPRTGEDMRTANVIAPRLNRFIQITGDPDQQVQHLHFDGLHFEHLEWNIPTEGLPPAQAVINVDATAVQVDHANNIQFRNGSVQHIGSTAFWFRQNTHHCRIDNSRLFDLGISGVRIGETQIPPPEMQTHHITVHNSIIQSGGRLAPPAVGVWIGHSPDNTILHCDIGDFFYTGVSVGWRWGYDESTAKRNRIEYNHIHHLGYRILSDMGGVYTLGPSEGSHVSHNHIHDVYSTRYGGWGLYPDEGSTGITFENNLVHHVQDGTVHQHYGKQNVFRNNILAFSEQGQIAVTRSEPHLSFTFQNNIVYFDQGTLLGYGGWKAGANVLLRSNLYWRAESQPFDFNGQSFQEWQSSGKDSGSIIADPLFTNPSGRDFTLLSNSPITQIGFKPFDPSLAGVYGTSNWTRLANSISFPTPYSVPNSH
ncbi:MAG: hypothetical protein RI897_3166 [Verrucomicrobiota bacterium]|jgi:hypothetical protein